MAVADLRTPGSRVAGVLGRRGRIPAAVLVALLLVAAAAPIVAPRSPEALDLANRRAAPSLTHWFGTDELGRDVLTRVLYGARVTLAVGLLSALVAAAAGVTVGAIGGYAGGWVDAVLMRVTDAALTVPRLPLLMIASAVLNPSVPVLIVVVGLAGWMETARLVRAEFLTAKPRAFVEAARAAGSSAPRVIVHHLLPIAAPSIAVSMTLAVGRGMLLESAMSFFGVGVQPPTPSWGNMLYQAQTTMSSQPWLALFPGACIFATALCINLLGDSLSQTTT
jgi:peptide/nickel transport system permease protein